MFPRLMLGTPEPWHWLRREARGHPRVGDSAGGGAQISGLPLGETSTCVCMCAYI